MIEETDIRVQLERLHQESFGWALSLCQYDSAKADELLQTAYVNILARNSMFSERSTFRTWLFAVIRKTALELRRREWVRSLRFFAADPDETRVDPARRPEENVQEEERSRILRAALGALPRRQREVLQLVFYHDVSVAEAAEVMAVSVGAARRHYDRAKQRLRERLGGETLA